MLPLEVQHKFIDDCLYIEKNKDKVPSNFEEFLKGRFGNTLYDLYFQPYNEKVWRRNLNTVPLSWLEGKLPMPTVHEMIFNNINHVKEKNFVHATFWYENKGGSQFIVDKLAKGLDICYDTDIDSITLENGKWVIAGRTFDKVVFCGNIKDMVKSIRGVNLEAYIPKVNDLEYHGTTAVFCEIDKNPYSWIYQPSRKHESHRIICTGNFAKSNNDDSLPNDRITATVEFTDEISKEDILSNLAKLPLNPKYVEHKYNKYTYPIQNANTREMIKSLKSSLSKFEFYFTGRFADWEYYNMDVAVGAAMDLCKNI
jgi:protoporphyrinogen oxidase